MIINKIKKSKQGAVALLLVIMITALTVVSAVVVSMTNISNLMSSYFFGEAGGVEVELDACLEDAMWRLASSTSATGTYYLNGIGVNCYYEIASTITDGLKAVTATASSTTDNIGYWQDTIVVQINVSSTPISIDSYKNSTTSYDTFEYCGNGIVEDGEVCDEGYDYDAGCGNGVVESAGNYCKADCSDYITIGSSEGCDYYSLSPCGATDSPSTDAVNCSGRDNLCNISCTACISICF